MRRNSCRPWAARCRNLPCDHSFLLNGYQADLPVRPGAGELVSVEDAQAFESRLACLSAGAAVGHGNRGRHAGVEQPVAVPAVVDRGPQQYGVIHARLIFRGAYLQHPAVGARRVLPGGKGARAGIAALKNRPVRRGIVGRLEIDGGVEAVLYGQVAGHGVPGFLDRAEGGACVGRGGSAGAALRYLQGRCQLDWPAEAHRLVVTGGHAEPNRLSTLLDVHDVGGAVDLACVGRHAAEGVGQGDDRLVGRVRDQAAAAESIPGSADQRPRDDVAPADLLQRQGGGHAVVPVQGIAGKGRFHIGVGAASVVPCAGAVAPVDDILSEIRRGIVIDVQRCALAGRAAAGVRDLCGNGNRSGSVQYSRGQGRRAGAADAGVGLDAVGFDG